APVAARARAAALAHHLGHRPHAAQPSQAAAEWILQPAVRDPAPVGGRAAALPRSPPLPGVVRAALPARAAGAVRADLAGDALPHADADRLHPRHRRDSVPPLETPLVFHVVALSLCMYQYMSALS